MNQLSPQQAMLDFGVFIQKFKDKGYQLMTIGWPINFDWQWINYYFYRYIGSNPLGFSAIDIKSYVWGLTRNKNKSTKEMVKEYADPEFQHTHKGVDDALEQGAIFVRMWNNMAK
jgi:hypothetical protein